MTGTEAQPGPAGEYEPNSRVLRIREHIEARFEAGAVTASPFPHMILSDFFPTDVFAEILRLNIFNSHPGEQWMSKKSGGKTKTATPYHSRKQINFHRSRVMSELAADYTDFWQDIQDTFLADDWFTALVNKKYQAYFDIRFGDAQKRDDFYSLFRKELFLQRHEPGYFIGPHTDVPQRVFTCIFSFAEKQGYEEFGTQLLAPKHELARCYGYDHYEPDLFREVGVAPYSPNNFLLFFKTRQSFHAVRRVDETVPNQRYGMQFQFYETGRGVFDEMSKPDLYVNTRIEKPRRGLLSRIKRALR